MRASSGLEGDHSAWLEAIEPAVLADRLMFLDRLHSTLDAQARARTDA